MTMINVHNEKVIRIAASDMSYVSVVQKWRWRLLSLLSNFLIRKKEYFPPSAYVFGKDAV